MAIVLAASSAFVGLKSARTLSGSIPAALISILILRYRNANILENNIIQTIASTGGAVAMGVACTLPALIIIGYWQSFNYFQTMLIVMIGGIWSVLFSVLLRSNMLIKENLPYPEGIVAAEILKMGKNIHGESTKVLLTSSLLSAIVSFLQTGFKIASEQIQGWVRIGTAAFGGSIMLSPMLMAVGYIVGIRSLAAFFVGGILTWCIAIPLFVCVYGLPKAWDVASSLALIQKLHFRYVAVGVLIIGGIWSVFGLIKPIKNVFMNALKRKHERYNMLRTQGSLPFKYVIFSIISTSVLAFILFFIFIKSINLELNNSTFWTIILFVTLFSLLVGFIVSVIATYIVGIVGTASLPFSGITIAAVIVFSDPLLVLLKPYVDFSVNTDTVLRTTAIIIIFGTITYITAILSSNNMQVLKVGQLVGVTPWKQQLMLGIGVITSALVIPLILQTTFIAYGIENILPRLGMDLKQTLPAPEATLMATITKGFFVGKLPFFMIKVGMVLAIIAIILDEFLRITKSTVRFPVLLFALGIYLPLGYVTAFLVGGTIRCLTEGGQKTTKKALMVDYGILCASGIVAGEVVLGVVLTIPFAYYQSTEIFVLRVPSLIHYEIILGIMLYIGLCGYLYKQARKKQ